MMKKAMLCIIFSLFVLLSACTNGNEGAYKDENSVLNNGNIAETSNEYETGLNISNTTEASNDYEVEYPLISIDSVEKYNKFLDEKSSDQKFISYSVLHEIGEFKRITILSNANAGDYSNYMYELCDASGYTLYLYVRVGIPEGSEKMVSKEYVNLHDLRKLNDKSSGAYVCNGYEYRYVNGELLSIKWENEAYSFVLSGESMLSNYPETRNTILGSLLTIDTASGATIDLQKMMLE